jgi:hypothetical protein
VARALAAWLPAWLLLGAIAGCGNDKPGAEPEVADTASSEPEGETAAPAADSDADGWTTAEGDCDDGNAFVNPGEAETCDDANADEDCDGLADDADGYALGKVDWHADRDEDGWGDPDTYVSACDAPAGYTALTGDCDDSTATANPGVPELCDGLDNDCDGEADVPEPVDIGAWYLDSDGDGYGDAATTVTACQQPSGYAASANDCDDQDSTRSPGAAEVCDSIDNDCDGTVDAGAVDAPSWYLDEDGDGYGGEGAAIRSGETAGAGEGGDCDDADEAA